MNPVHLIMAFRHVQITAPEGFSAGWSAAAGWDTAAAPDLAARAGQRFYGSAGGVQPGSAGGRGGLAGSFFHR